MNTHGLIFSDLLPLITEQEAWALTCAACTDQIRIDGDRMYPETSVRLFLNGCLDERGNSPLLPNEKDGGFAGYINRINNLTGKHFSLNLSHFHTLSWELYKRLLRVIDSLGYGSGERPVYVGLFTGNDRYSAVGAHLDPNYEDFFQYVVAGKKRAYLWDRDSLSLPEQQLLSNSSDIQSHAKQASIIEAEAGEVLHWPGHCFHVMENLTDYSIGLTIGFRTELVAYARTDLIELLLEYINSAMKGYGPENYTVEEVTATTGRLLMYLNDADAIERHLLRKRLSAKSSRGLHHSPRLMEISVDPSARFYCPPDTLVVFNRHRDVLLVSCCGHVLEFHHEPVLTERILTALPDSRTGAMTAMEVCESIGIDISNALKQALKTLEVFASIGAVKTAI